MEGIMGQVFIEPFKEFLSKIAGFLPNVLTSLVLVCAGLLCAWLFKTVTVRIAWLIKADAISEKIGAAHILQKGGIKEPLSRLTGRFVYWVVLIAFFIMGLDALKMPAVEDLLGKFLLYLPNVIVAGMVMLLGYLLGNFLGRAVLIASVNAGMAFAGLLGRFVKLTALIMSTAMALELLGIGKETVLVAFAIVFGGVVLALAIALGIGGTDAAKEYIEKVLKEKKEDDGIEHI
jgi:hypothetical protein